MCVDQFSNEHPVDVEELWAALVGWWPNNITVIINYLVVLLNMSATSLLPFVSLVIVVLLQFSVFNICHFWHLSLHRIC